MQAGRREVNVSSPDKVLFPQIGLTKLGLAEYYARVAPFSLPHLRGRPLNLDVYPQGIEADGFFQQHASGWFPDWVDRVRVPKKGGSVEHAVANRADTLVYLAGQNAVTCTSGPVARTASIAPTGWSSTSTPRRATSRGLAGRPGCSASCCASLS